MPPVLFAPIRGLILDVDGVLTDGGIVYTDRGEELKRFDAKDGAGLKYWQRAGHTVALLSGRESPAVSRRAAELGITVVAQNAKDKLPVLERLCRRLDLPYEAVAYVGDDLPDIPVLQRVGLGIAVADATLATKDAARAVTEALGGRGAVREVIETILRGQNLWHRIMRRYLPEGDGDEAQSRESQP